MSAMVEKLVWVVVGAALLALSQWPPMAGVRDMLLLIAGGLPGSALFRSVDDRRAARASMRPPAP